MNCQYCQAVNDFSDDRCVRCGRRLHLASPRPAPDSYQPGGSLSAGTRAATAAALSADFFEQPEEDARPEDDAGRVEAHPSEGRLSSQGFGSIAGGLAENHPQQARSPQPNSPQPVYQQTLFREGSPKVVAIPTMTPLRPMVREPQSRRAPRPQNSRPNRSATQVRSQQDLQFGGEPELAASSEVICCDAPVALPVHRMLAAIIDTSLVLVGAGVFLGVFMVAGGEMVLNRQTVPFLIGVVTVLALFYRVLWCIADGDTPGMRFAGLRLVDFDGRRPTREMRGLRQASGLLSLFSVGLGLVWALVDEENLTWHDHISKTFPTAG